MNIISFIREFFIKTIGFRRTSPLSTGPVVAKFEKVKKEMEYITTTNLKFAQDLETETMKSIAEMEKAIKEMRRNADNLITEATKEAEIAENWSHNLGIMGAGKITIKETQKK